MCSDHYLSVLWSNFRFCTGDRCCGRKYDDPALIELGYEKDFSTAIVAVAGGLGVIIPPSIPFIMYAMATGESVSELFWYRTGHDDQRTADLYAYYYCRRHGEDREKIQAKWISSKQKDSLTF